MKDRSPSGGYDNLFFSNLGSKRSRPYPPFLPLSEMHMRRRPIHARRQRTVERQFDPPLGVALSAHPQNLTGMSVLKPQTIVRHSFLPILIPLIMPRFVGCARRTGGRSFRSTDEMTDSSRKPACRRAGVSVVSSTFSIR
jgi:hypothetical protein